VEIAGKTINSDSGRLTRKKKPERKESERERERERERTLK
jgi:hypothetical protein